jgi:hypothetical protein
MTPALVVITLLSPKVLPPTIESPKPKIEAPAPPARIPYWDTLNRIELGAGAAAAAVDMRYTCRNLDSGGREYTMPAHNCGQAVAFTVGLYAGAEGVAYLLHRTGHHKLERIPVLYLIGANIHGAAYSAAHSPEVKP